MSLGDKLKTEAKAQAEKRAAQVNFEKLNWYKPNTGDNFFRILPHWSKPDDELFFVKVIVHFGIEIPKQDGSGTVAIAVKCPRTYGKPCDVCDIWDKVAKDKALRDQMQAVRPVERYLYNILSLTKKGDGSFDGQIAVWPMPTSVHQDVFKWVDELGSDFADIKKGRGWKLIKEVTPGKSAATGTKYSVMPQINPSELAPKFVELLKGMVDLNGVYPTSHEAELAKVGAYFRSKFGVITAAGVATGSAFAGIAAGDDGFATPKKEASVATAATGSAVATAAKPATDGDGFATTGPKGEPTATVSVEDADLEAELKKLGVN